MAPGAPATDRGKAGRFPGRTAEYRGEGRTVDDEPGGDRRSARVPACQPAHLSIGQSGHAPTGPSARRPICGRTFANVLERYGITRVLTVAGAPQGRRRPAHRRVPRCSKRQGTTEHADGELGWRAGGRLSSPGPGACRRRDPAERRTGFGEGASPVGVSPAFRAGPVAAEPVRKNRTSGAGTLRNRIPATSRR